MFLSFFFFSVYFMEKEITQMLMLCHIAAFFIIYFLPNLCPRHLWHLIFIITVHYNGIGNFLPHTGDGPETILECDPRVRHGHTPGTKQTHSLCDPPPETAMEQKGKKKSNSATGHHTKAITTRWGGHHRWAVSRTALWVPHFETRRARRRSSAGRGAAERRAAGAVALQGKKPLSSPGSYSYSLLQRHCRRRLAHSLPY